MSEQGLWEAGFVERTPACSLKQDGTGLCVLLGAGRSLKSVTWKEVKWVLAHSEGAGWLLNLLWRSGVVGRSGSWESHLRFPLFHMFCQDITLKFNFKSYTTHLYIFVGLGVRILISAWRDGSVSTDTCFQAAWPELDPLGPTWYERTYSQELSSDSPLLNKQVNKQEIIITMQ